MSLAAKLLSASGGRTKLYVDDVFSAYTYAGNSSTQTINNGIDLAGSGGLVWTKCRSSGTSGTDSHRLNDTVRGFTYRLSSDRADVQVGNNITGSQFGVTGFNSNGYSLMDGLSSVDLGYNYAGKTYVSWTFRKAPKFFDVVTYTGNGLTDKSFTHSLGVQPGMVIIKATSAGSTNWIVQHKDLRASRQYLVLNSGAAAVATVSSPTAISWSESTTIYVHGGWPTGAGNDLNTNGVTYVAYLFAHDDSADGIIQCGSFTTDGSSNATVSLGWEPQFLMVKSASAVSSWESVDTCRGFTANDGGAALEANQSSTEFAINTQGRSKRVTSTGFTVTDSHDASYIYLAIRRPNKPPTNGIEVYNAIARTGTSAAATVTGVGFAPDLAWAKHRGSIGRNGSSIDKLRGTDRLLHLQQTAAEVASSDTLMSFDMNGVTLGADGLYGTFNASGEPSIQWFFRRAPGFFDVVCWTGDGGGILREVPHSLGAMPELIISKARSNGYAWAVADATMTYQLELNSTAAGNLSGGLAGYSSTSTFKAVWAANKSAQYNDVGVTYVSYLFATLPNVSKVGNYIGNGTSQTIACGFTTGARFILIKRIDAVGDWYTWDTVRGIVASNDPHLSLNTTASEVATDDSVDPHTSGFIINQVAATGINVTGAAYIFLAIA